MFGYADKIIEYLINYSVQSLKLKFFWGEGVRGKGEEGNEKNFKRLAGFSSMKQLRVLILPPDRDASQ